MPIQNKPRFEDKIKKYDKETVVSSLASLFLYPQNHQFTVTLEKLVMKVLCVEFEDKVQFNYHNFKKAVLEAGISPNDDPVNTHFVDNFQFSKPQKDFLVLPGITQSGGFDLQNLMDAICNPEPNSTTEKFYSKISSSVNLILLISDRILKECGLNRLSSSDNDSKHLFIPAEKVLCTVRKKFVITENTLEEYTKDSLSKKQEINNFIAQFETNSSCQEIIALQLQSRPFVKCGKKIILALPTNVLDSIRHFILVKMSKTKLKFKDGKIKPFHQFLFKKYREQCREKLNDIFTSLDARPETLPLGSEKDLPILEGFYSFDFNSKKIYFVAIMDDFQRYTEESLYGGLRYDKDINRRIVSRIREMFSLISTDTKNENIFCISSIKMGRSLHFSIEEMPTNNKHVLTFSISLEELSILPQINIDIYDLQLYLSRRKAQEDMPRVFFSFLDEFSLYHSEISSDNYFMNSPPSLTVADVNIGNELRKMSKEYNDTHLVQFINQVVKVQLYWRNKAVRIPVYKLISTFRRTEIDTSKPEAYNKAHIWEDILYQEIPHARLLEINSTTIWIYCPFVQPERKKEEMNQINEFLSDISDVFAFLFLKGYHILERILPLYRFTQLDIKLLPLTNERLDTTVKIDKNCLFLDIQIPYLPADKDDLGGKIVRNMFTSLLKKFEKRHNCLNEIQTLVSNVAPLIQKAYSRRIDRMWKNMNLYSIKQGYIDLQLDNLGQKMGCSLPKKGEGAYKIEEGKRIEFIEKIQDYFYVQLQQKISKFDKSNLLILLMEQYESYLVFRSKTNYVSLLGFESEKKKKYMEVLREDIDARNSTTVHTPLCLRTLIEMISSMQQSGKLRPTLTDYHQLLALMHRYINFGIMRDLMHYKMLDSDIYLLSSGRIDFSDNNYRNAKISLLINKEAERSVNMDLNYHLSHDVLKGKIKNYETIYNNAFVEEFGIDREILDNFISYIRMLMINKVKIRRQSEVVKKVKKYLNLDEEIVIDLIKKYSLTSRDCFLVPPEGYKDTDIFPWEFNRPLTYYRKPIVHFVSKEKDYLIWGGNNVARSRQELETLIFTGRYKSRKMSKKMNNLLGMIRDIKGKMFEEAVYQRIREMYPNNKTKFQQRLYDRDGKYIKQLGDIDILTLNKDTSVVYSIECKNIYGGRIPREWDSEIKKFSNTQDERKGSWISKHKKRENWLKENPWFFKEHFNLDSIQKIHSIIVVPEEGYISYFPKLDIDCISMHKLQNGWLNFSAKL